MDVFVTGGTGFVGAHTVRSLIDRGHRVRLAVRDEARVAPALLPLGVDPDSVDVVTAPLSDRDRVRAAMDGCDAVVHAAAVYSWDARDAEEMGRTNATLADVVLGSAVDGGMDPVVHVSSTVAIARTGGGRLDNGAPMGDLPGSYPRSKRDCDVVARRLQSEGAPVARVHPGGMLGPHDPHLGETDRQVRDILRGLYPTWTKGQIAYGDVRDTADTIAAVVDRTGRGPSAWIAPSHDVKGGEMHARLRRLTGRRLPVLLMPDRLIAPAARAARMPIRLLPSSVPIPFPTEGGIDLYLAANSTDDTETLRELGVRRRDLDDTLRDTVRWLVDAGHLSARQAGAVLG